LTIWQIPHVRAIEFTKYCAHGNHFVVIDETQFDVVAESRKASVARHMLDTAYGCGGDDVLYLQRAFVDARRDLLAVGDVPAVGDMDVNRGAGFSPVILFRLFEPDGTEALVCGNGMRCAMSYLNRQYGYKEVTFATEFPSGRLVARAATMAEPATSDRDGVPEVDMGELGTPGKELWSADIVNGCVQLEGTHVWRVPSDLMEGLIPPFWSELRHELVLVHPGEPYVIALRSDPTLPPEEAVLSLQNIETFDDWAYAVATADAFIPSGVNVIAGIAGAAQWVAYRVFERIKNRETGSSGSGAVAMVAGVHILRWIDARRGVEVFAAGRPTGMAPRPSDRMRVQLGSLSNWLLRGSVVAVYDGRFLAGDFVSNA
jgi:diaminopimelate epimerase